MSRATSRARRLPARAASSISLTPRLPSPGVIPEVAEADAVGLGREHVEAGGRGVDAGEDDGEVGGGADLRAGLRGVAARGGDDDRDRLCFCTTAAERADRVSETVAGAGRDVGEALKLDSEARTSMSRSRPTVSACVTPARSPSDGWIACCSSTA